VRIDLARYAQAHPTSLVEVGITGVQGPCTESRPEWYHGVWPPEWCEEQAKLPRQGGMPMVQQAARYKYIIVIDGWASPDRLLALLNSGCVLLLPGPIESFPDGKVTVFAEFWHAALKPFYNYVPFNSSNMSNLYERVSWLRSHDKVAHAIQKRARTLFNSITQRCTTAIFEETLLEYARRCDERTKAMTVEAWLHELGPAFGTLPRQGANHRWARPPGGHLAYNKSSPPPEPPTSPAFAL